LKANKKAVK